MTDSDKDHSADFSLCRRRARDSAPVGMPVNAQPAAGNCQLSKLSEILHEWKKNKKKPAALADLSSEEYAAMCIASGSLDELVDPFNAFVRLDPSLKRWLLEMRAIEQWARTSNGRGLGEGA